jgi:hypothetical protein
MDLQSEISGGLAYSLKYQDRSYAATNRSGGVKVLQALYEAATSKGGKLYYAPHMLEDRKAVKGFLR